MTLKSKLTRQIIVVIEKLHMTLKDQLVQAITEKPLELREVLAEISGKFTKIGVQIGFFELHAPPEDSNVFSGVGETLCKRSGRRHKQVTCKNCIKKLAKR